MHFCKQIPSKLTLLVLSMYVMVLPLRLTRTQAAVMLFRNGIRLYRLHPTLCSCPQAAKILQESTLVTIMNHQNGLHLAPLISATCNACFMDVNVGSTEKCTALQPRQHSPNSSGSSGGKHEKSRLPYYCGGCGERKTQDTLTLGSHVSLSHSAHSFLICNTQTQQDTTVRPHTPTSGRAAGEHKVVSYTGGTATNTSRRPQAARIKM